MVEKCKGCGEELTNIHPALSRYGYGDICPDCGVREALEGNFISKLDPYMPEHVDTKSNG